MCVYQILHFITIMIIRIFFIARGLVDRGGGTGKTGEEGEN